MRIKVEKPDPNGIARTLAGSEHPAGQKRKRASITNEEEPECLDTSLTVSKKTRLGTQQRTSPPILIKPDPDPRPPYRPAATSASPLPQVNSPHTHEETNATPNPAFESESANPSRGPTQSPGPRSQYSEFTPFIFKFIISYTNADKTEYSFHASTDLADAMSAFWHLLRRLQGTWEDAAGADWAWEFQKPARRGRRLCVSSKLAKRRTVWREGDEGFFACGECVALGRPCFTWVGDENAEGAFAGEFWCLPVMEEDRRCEVKVGKEMKIWVNEAREGRYGSETGDEESASGDEYETDGEGGGDGSESSSSDEE